ncbi:Hsp20/alpha crystallin family protein [Patescibacteria group bacterium]|nr:Hsp20/alpha crystallin family protein [Patescibacteria group bacterium]MBU4511894.1 Hsp20/alpha crystallin family protein [Patescibacteria group bacterium]MCG2692861.1 Hsp20/alpha crystallin family protein [Candidatus Parcubacteria bacterium]
MHLTHWSPFLEPFMDDFDLAPRSFVPAMDVYQDKDNVVVETPITGVDPEKLDISVENDVLSVTGESEHKSEVDEKNYYRKEVRYGSFHRSVALPASVDGLKAKAEYENGVLKVIIPKAERAKPKKIQVEIKK